MGSRGSLRGRGASLGLDLCCCISEHVEEGCKVRAFLWIILPALLHHTIHLVGLITIQCTPK